MKEETLYRCAWCELPLRFELGRGWVHIDGKLYRTRIDDDGVERDDHCASPDLSRTPWIARY